MLRWIENLLWPQQYIVTREVVATVTLEGTGWGESQEPYRKDRELLVYDEWNQSRPYWRLPAGTYEIVRVG